MTVQKNSQGFVVIGLDFAKNYNQPIHACFQFEFMGYEISVSTGACDSVKNSYPGLLSEIRYINLSTGETFFIAGSVEDAIKEVIKLSSQVKPKLVNLTDYATGEAFTVDLNDCTAKTQHPYSNKVYSKLYTKLHFSNGAVYSCTETPEQIDSL